MNAIVFPASKPLSGIINPPSSKNYTTRVILSSCLAEGTSRVFYPAVQDDAVALVHCCRELGAKITAFDQDSNEVSFELESRDVVHSLTIEGFGSSPKTPESGIIDPDNAGAVLRLLMGVISLCPSPVRIETKKYPHSLGKRPNVDLVDALRQMGIEIETENEEATLPLILDGGQKIHDYLKENNNKLSITISGAVSSQYLSSLLFLAPLLPAEIEIQVTGGLKSKPLIRTSLDVLADAGITIQASEDLESFQISGKQEFKSRDWYVNGDWPGMTAVLAAVAVIPNSSITVLRMQKDQQGEQRCLDFFEAMGCRYDWDMKSETTRLTFSSPSQLVSAEIDGDTATDGVLGMMGAASLAEGTSRFDGIMNLQFKECDRVREPIAEMKKIYETLNGGVDSAPFWEPVESPETIYVPGSATGFEGGLTVDGRGDHRVIMLLSIMALRSQKPITITGAEHVAKSFPAWFDVLRQMGVKLEFSNS